MTQSATASLNGRMAVQHSASARLDPRRKFEELPGVAHNLWVTDRAVTPRQIREVLKGAQGSTSYSRALNISREAAGLQPLADEHDTRVAESVGADFERREPRCRICSDAGVRAVVIELLDWRRCPNQFGP